MISTNSPLELLHLDLFGPINILSILRKRFVLVIVDDYSRFTWVIFLSQKIKYLSNLSSFVIGLKMKNLLKLILSVVTM
jgi:hypothetical protein